MSQLSEKLAQLAITIESKHLGLVQRDDEGNWLSDSWECTISYGGKSIRASYLSGIGHRKLALGVKKEGLLKYFRDNSGEAAFSDEEACRKGLLLVVKPMLADVMCCLLSDASGAEDTFYDWCANFGSDPDSRKQLDIYLQCQKTLVDLRKVFGYSLFEQLKELEH